VFCVQSDSFCESYAKIKKLQFFYSVFCVYPVCNFRIFRAIFRHDNVLLHTVYDYFGEDELILCCNQLRMDVSYAKRVSIS